MLVLTRCPGQEVVIDTPDGRVVVRFVELQGGKIRLGVTAPRSVKIVRSELLEKKDAEGGKTDAPSP